MAEKNPGQTGLNICIISDLAGLRAIEGACDALFRSCAQPYIKSSFPYVIADATGLAAPGEWRCIAAFRGEVLAGCLYGRRVSRTVMGLALPVFELQTELLLEEPGGEYVLAALLAALQDDQSDCLYVAFKHLSPPAFEVLERCLRSMNRRFSWHWAGYVYHVDTSGTEAAFLGGLDGKKRREIDRRERRLGARHALEYVCDEGSDPVLDAQRLEEFIALEDSGWKGSRYSSIMRRAGMRQFYRELVMSASRAGQTVWHSLRIDGRPVAMYLCLRSHGTLWLPKVAYDEAFARDCPGILLTHRILKWCHARDDINEVNCTSGAAWMQSWNPQKRHLRNLNLYGATLKSQLAWQALTLRHAVRTWRQDKNAPPIGYDQPIA